MAADAVHEKTLQEGSATSKLTSKSWLPTEGAARSRWHSSFHFPLTHTSLRAYLSPQKEKELKAGMPLEALQEKYYNESIKFTYIQGLFDSREIDFHVQQHRRCRRQPDNVKELLEESENKQSSDACSSHQTRNRFRCTGSSVEHGILEHSGHTAEMPPRTTAKSTAGSRWRVSAKIGSRTWGKDKVDTLANQCWAPTDIRSITTQGENLGKMHAQTELEERDGDQQRRPLTTQKMLPGAGLNVSKPVKSMRSGAKSAKSNIVPCCAAALAPLVLRGMESQVQQYTSPAAPLGELAENNGVPPRPSEAASPQRRKRRGAAYMPKFMQKPHLMDTVEGRSS